MRGVKRDRGWWSPSLPDSQGCSPPPHSPGRLHHNDVTQIETTVIDLTGGSTSKRAEFEWFCMKFCISPLPPSLSSPSQISSSPSTSSILPPFSLSLSCSVAGVATNLPLLHSGISRIWASASAGMGFCLRWLLCENFSSTYFQRCFCWSLSTPGETKGTRQRRHMRDRHGTIVVESAGQVWWMNWPGG